jgi:hypothetical protein
MSAPDSKNHNRYFLGIGFIVSFCFVGFPYWSVPYSNLNLPTALLGLGLWVVVISAFLLRYFRVASFWKVSAILGASIPAVVLARVVADGLKDPTSHNLWPFEMVIAFVVGAACSLTGSISAAVISLVAVGRRSRGSESQ